MLKIKIKMNPRVKIIAIIILISLCFLFGFKKISHYINEPNNKDIQEYKILSYIPSDNKLLFISNIEISKMIKNT